MAVPIRARDLSGCAVRGGIRSSSSSSRVRTPTPSCAVGPLGRAAGATGSILPTPAVAATTRLNSLGKPTRSHTRKGTSSVKTAPKQGADHDARAEKAADGGVVEKWVADVRLRASRRRSSAGSSSPRCSPGASQRPTCWRWCCPTTSTTPTPTSSRRSPSCSASSLPRTTATTAGATRCGSTPPPRRQLACERAWPSRSSRARRR